MSNYDNDFIDKCKAFANQIPSFMPKRKKLKVKALGKRGAFNYTIRKFEEDLFSDVVESL